MASIHGEGKPPMPRIGRVRSVARRQKADDEGLIVFRGACFVLMNLFPYNSGHLLVCPCRHVSDYTELTNGSASNSAT